MKSKSTAVILALMLALVLVTSNVAPVISPIEPPIVGYPSGPFEKFGPRVDKLTFKVAGSVTAEADLLEAGEIDIMDWAAPGARWESWLADPAITMGNFSELAMIYFALNVQRWPLGHGDQLPHGWTAFPPGYRGSHVDELWPTEWGGTADALYVDYDHCQRCNDARWFRQGISYLLNREAIIGELVGVTEMETLIEPPIVESWENPAAPRYDYDPALAALCFENGGFLDYDEDNWLEYSPSHAADPPGPTGPTDMEELPTLQIYIRADDQERTYAGSKWIEDLDLAGVPNQKPPLIVSNTECSLHCWQNYDYDVYIEYWDWGVPLPDLYYEGFHTDKDLTPVYYESYNIQPDGSTIPGAAQWVPWSDNSVRYHNKEYDVQGELFTKSLSPAEALAPCYEMQMMLHGDAVVIPLYAHVGFNGHSTEYCGPETKYAGLTWEGFDNEPGISFYSLWTLLNAHPEGFERGTDGLCTLRHGLVNDVVTFNILKTWWFYDLQVLLNIYEPLIRMDPHNQTNYVPWLCEGYNVGTWTKPGGAIASAINFTLIPDILWQDGVPMTAADVAFTMEHFNYTKAVSYYTTTEKIHSTVIHANTPKPGKETIEIRFHDKSWLALSWASLPVIIPKHIWEGKDPDWDPVANHAVIGTGPFRFFGDPDGAGPLPRQVGCVDRVLGQYVYLQRNPNYFRKLARPDFYPAGAPDGAVDIDDFGTAVGQFGTFYPYWLSPVYGPLADVNKDLVVDIDDLMEVAVRFGDTGYEEGYPPYYN